MLKQGVLCRGEDGCVDVVVETKAECMRLGDQDVLVQTQCVCQGPLERDLVQDAYPQLISSKASIGSICTGVVLKIGSLVSDVYVGDLVVCFLHPIMEVSGVSEQIVVNRANVMQYLHHSMRTLYNAPSRQQQFQVTALTAHIQSYISALPVESKLNKISEKTRLIYIPSSPYSIVPDLLSSQHFSVVVVVEEDATFHAYSKHANVHGVIDQRGMDSNTTLREEILKYTGQDGARYILCEKTLQTTNTVHMPSQNITDMSSQDKNHTMHKAAVNTRIQELSVELGLAVTPLDLYRQQEYLNIDKSMNITSSSTSSNNHNKNKSNNSKIELATLIHTLAPGSQLLFTTSCDIGKSETQYLLLKSATVKYINSLALLLHPSDAMHITHDILKYIQSNRTEIAPYLQNMQHPCDNIAAYNMTYLHQAVEQMKLGKLVIVHFEK